MKLFYFGVMVLLSAASGESHNCERPCVAGDTRTCRYKFHLEEYHTLSRACFDCPSNLEDCSRPECIAADGVPRSLLTVNRTLPGPAIQVCEGDRVIVDFYNKLLSGTETIHWHGQHMKGYQFYDGVPFITQCPIVGAFRYDFVADTPGTTFWHSHSGVHRLEGIYGAFVVRQAEDPQRATYDVDCFDHYLMVQDYYHRSSVDIYSGFMHASVDTSIDTILVNGKGTNTKAKKEHLESYDMPLEVVKVKQGLRNRLRLVHAGFDCPIVVSIDNHRMTVIASDGQNNVPFTVDSIVLYSGERFDIVVETNQEVGNYWIRFNGILFCAINECVQGAILRYDGATDELPPHPLEYEAAYPPGTVLNGFNTAGGTPNTMTMMDMDALESYSLPEEVDKQFFVALDYKAVNNTAVFHELYYPYSAVDAKLQMKTPQINGVTFKNPNSPPLTQFEEARPTICNHGEDMSPYCQGDFCSCTYVFNVDLGDMVELVLVDEGTYGVGNHPFHMHGYSFSVVAMGKVGATTTSADVAVLDAKGFIQRKLENPMLKDTVNIVDGGYTIIRFKADNPGFWLMHCHLILHSEAGMVAVLHVGDQSDLPPTPEGFPTCTSFLPEI